MFIIIGGDRKEYGPVTANQVRAWISAGRANLDTKAKTLGSDEWRRLGDYAEFAGPGETPPVLPPPIPDAAGMGDIRSDIAEPLLASRGVRTGAAVLNAFVYFVSMMPGATMMSRGLIERNPELAKGGIPRINELDLTGVADGATWLWAGLLAAMFVQAILIAIRGQNIGKLVLGGRVVRFADGQPAGILRGVVLRFFLPVMIVMFLNILFPLGCIFLAVDYCFIFRDDQRCLHDLIAGTKVVR